MAQRFIAVNRMDGVSDNMHHHERYDMNSYPEIILSLPQWVKDFVADAAGKVYPTVEERMIFVIALARLNIRHNTGGPFGAAVFDADTHELIAPGVNLVLSADCSVFHAEITAIMIAQKIARHYDLANGSFPSCELVCSTEPCAMCFGAIHWSGIRKLVCGARDEDARAIGFDEGPKLRQWDMALEKNNIRVLRDVCRKESVEVLQEYRRSDGIIYNPVV